jgi:hypothetical protein
MSSPSTYARYWLDQMAGIAVAAAWDPATGHLKASQVAELGFAGMLEGMALAAGDHPCAPYLEGQAQTIRERLGQEIKTERELPSKVVID